MTDLRSEIGCYRISLFVLKGYDEPFEHVKTNCVERPTGILICKRKKGALQ